MADEENGSEEQPQFSETQWRRVSKELRDANRSIDEAAEAVSMARGTKRTIIKRLEGYGIRKQALKLLEQFMKMPEEQREVVIPQLVKLAEWSKFSLFREAGNQGPAMEAEEPGNFGDVVKKLPKPLRGPGRPRRDEARTGL